MVAASRMANMPGLLCCSTACRMSVVTNRLPTVGEFGYLVAEFGELLTLVAPGEIAVGLREVRSLPARTGGRAGVKAFGQEQHVNDGLHLR